MVKKITKATFPSPKPKKHITLHPVLISDKVRLVCRRTHPPSPQRGKYDRIHGDKQWGFGAEDCTLAISLLDLYATSLGLGCCWGGYFYSAVNAHRPLFEDLGLQDHHKAYGAIMVGHPKFKYRRIPLRNPPQVTWK
jgi:nitroreductase